MLDEKLVKFCDNNFKDGKSILKKLCEFKKILIRENETMNLIGKSTIDNVDERHFLDCIQIVNYLPQHEKPIMDIGTGRTSGYIIIDFGSKPFIKMKNHQTNLFFLKIANCDWD